MMKRGIWSCVVLALALAAVRGPVWAQSPPRLPAARAPFPALSAAEQKSLDDVLNYWEQRSRQIQRYRCTFRRWEYDPVFGPRDTFKTYSEGQINYSAPDKGMFKVEKILVYQPPAQPAAEAQYVPQQGESGEYWICDGQSIFEHDYKNRLLIQYQLPPRMRGRAISEGPLPFLFGAEAEKIKQRYWVRRLPLPEGVKGEYWLEAYPKTRKDAANYQKVHVILGEEDFLPKALVIFDRNFDPRRNPARTTFTFLNREVNWNMLLEQLTPWRKQFYEPKVPFGWKKDIRPFQAAPDAEQVAPAMSGSASQARRGAESALSR